MSRIFKILIVLFSTVLLNACTSMTRIDTSVNGEIPHDKCNVTVYQTLRQAEKGGTIKELCIISGTSSGSFSHTIETAIAKHKDKACQCGASKVYVESRSVGGWGLAKVTLVAFEYEEN